MKTNKQNDACEVSLVFRSKLEFMVQILLSATDPLNFFLSAFTVTPYAPISRRLFVVEFRHDLATSRTQLNI